MVAVDYSTQVRSLLMGDNVRWTNFQNFPRNTSYIRPLGSPTVVTFSFEQALPSYMPASAAYSFRPLTEAEKGSVRQAAAMWDNASGVVMMEVGAGQGQIAISAYDFNTTGSQGLEGYASYPGYGAAGDVYFNTRNSISTGLALHEFGHALGLKHPFESIGTGVTLPQAEDKTTNTVLSYSGGFQTQLGPFDVAAIQYLYGPNSGPEAAYPAGYTAQSYLAANPDVLQAVGTDFGAANYHYLAAGIWEGRNASFNALGYIASNPDLIHALGANTAAGTDHYVYGGFREGRSTNSFNPYAYLASHRDLEAAFGRDEQAATLHYITGGAAEGRTVAFDPYAYMAANRDLLRAFGSDTTAGVRHYLDAGRAEGRPTSGFDAQSYLAANADLRAAFGNDTAAATKHYVQYGYRQGRPTIYFPPVTTATTGRAAMAAAADELQGDSIQIQQTEVAGFATPSAAHLADALPRLSGADTATARTFQHELTVPTAGLSDFGFGLAQDNTHTTLALYSPNGNNWF